MAAARDRLLMPHCRFRSAVSSRWALAAPVGLAIDDELVRGGGEPVHSGLCQQHVGHEAESLIFSPVGSDHCGRFLVAFDDQLVRVGRLGCIEAVRPEDVPGVAAGIGTLVAGIK